MGNTEQSSPTSYLLRQGYEWKHHASLGYCQLVKDLKRTSIGERYTCYVENFQRDLAVYEFRTYNMDWVVGIWSVEKGDGDYFCGSGVTVRVVTERIPYRLIDLGHVGYAEGLYIMGKCLRGAELIWKKIGSIEYDATMICFTPKGEAKIWLNQNLSLNSPKSRINMTEKELIAHIMQIVQVRMGGEKMQQYFASKEKWTFSDFPTAILFVNSMKNSVNQVNFVTLPSMVAEKFQMKKENSLLEGESIKSARSETNQKRKLPSGLPPLPPKSRSKSREKSKSKQNHQTPSAKAKRKVMGEKQTLIHQNGIEQISPNPNSFRLFSPQVKQKNSFFENQTQKQTPEKKTQNQNDFKSSQIRYVEINSQNQKLFAQSPTKKPMTIFNGLNRKASEKQTEVTPPSNMNKKNQSPNLMTTISEKKIKTVSLSQGFSVPKVNFTFKNSGSHLN